MAGVARFDCYPSDFLNGMVGMTADQVAVYAVFVLMQYDRGEAVQVDGRERELAVRTGMSRGRMRAAIAELVRIGKLNPSPEGYWDKRSQEELEKIRARIAKNAENSGKGGDATRQKFEALRNENRESDRPTGQPIGQPKIGPSFSASATISAKEEKVKSETSSDAPPAIDQERSGRQAYPADFEKFWSGFPTDSNMSKKEAGRAWARMDESRRKAAIASLPGFNAFCRADPSYRPVHACRYLTQERFDGHLKTSQKIAARIFVAKDSPQWNAWQKVKSTPTRKDQDTGAEGWDFPSEWPPREQPHAH